MWLGCVFCVVLDDCEIVELMGLDVCKFYVLVIGIVFVLIVLVGVL